MATRNEVQAGFDGWSVVRNLERNQAYVVQFSWTNSAGDRVNQETIATCFGDSKGKWKLRVPQALVAAAESKALGLPLLSKEGRDALDRAKAIEVGSDGFLELGANLVAIVSAITRANPTTSSVGASAYVEVSFKMTDGSFRLLKESTSIAGPTGSWPATPQPPEPLANPLRNADDATRVESQQPAAPALNDVWAALGNFGKVERWTAQFRPRLSVNVILEGVPGTGKTHALKRLAKEMNNLETIAAGRFATVMHPATSYEDFVEGLRPSARKTALSGGMKTVKLSMGPESEQITVPLEPPLDLFSESEPVWFFESPSTSSSSGFSIHDGFFVAACAEAVRNPSTPYVVLLDELNRCNIPKVMGDLITTMEVSKRARWNANGEYWNVADAQVVTLPYSKRKFFVPDNLSIVGTMNTTDRSVAPMDAALRRRFVFVRVEPSFERFRNTDVSAAAAKLSLINKALAAYLGPDAILGHSYLDDMQREVSAGADANAIERFWFEKAIFPMVVDTLVNHGCVAELASGQSKAAKEFVLDLGNEAKVAFSGRGVTQTIKLAWKSNATELPRDASTDAGTPEY